MSWYSRLSLDDAHHIGKHCSLLVKGSVVADTAGRRMVEIVDHQTIRIDPDWYVGYGTPATRDRALRTNNIARIHGSSNYTIRDVNFLPGTDINILIGLAQEARRRKSEKDRVRKEAKLSAMQAPKGMMVSLDDLTEFVQNKKAKVQ